MSLTRFDGRTGRTPKGGIKRRVVQAKMPEPLQEALFTLAEQTSVTVTDLGAYFLIEGWNAARAKQGLPPIPMPAYLEQSCGNQESVEVQNVLEESLLKAG